MSHKAYIVTATNINDDRCDWCCSTGRNSYQRALSDFNDFVAQGYRSVHIRELGELRRVATDGKVRIVRASDELQTTFVSATSE